MSVTKPPPDQTRTRLTTLLGPDELRRGLLRDAATGLTSTPKTLPPKYFYDDHGSELFEQITELPEYYPTRAERRLLELHGSEIATAANAEVLVELGSGSSSKTRLLLDAMTPPHAGPAIYIPVDVSAGALTAAVRALESTYPDLAVRGVVADFERHLCSSLTQGDA